MKIVVVNDSFKGSLESVEVANAIEKGIIKVFKDAEIIKKPLADEGGALKNITKIDISEMDSRIEECSF